MKKLIRKFTITTMLGLSIIAGVSCTKVMPKHLNFNMDGTEFDITVPAQDRRGDVVFTNQDADLNIDSAIKSKTAELYALESVKLTEINISIKNPQEQNFDAVENVRGYISSPGMSQQLVAQKEPMPKGINNVNMDLTDLELTPYLKNHPQFTLRGNVSQATKEPITLHVKTTYHVTVKKDL